MNIYTPQTSPLSSPGPSELQTRAIVATPAGTSAPGSFSTMVSDLLKSTSAEQDKLNGEAERLMTGEASNFHEISLAVARSDISFRFMMEVRDQAVGAYREVMRMQI